MNYNTQNILQFIELLGSDFFGIVNGSSELSIKKQEIVFNCIQNDLSFGVFHHAKSDTPNLKPICVAYGYDIAKFLVTAFAKDSGYYFNPATNKVEKSADPEDNWFPLWKTFDAFAFKRFVMRFSGEKEELDKIDTFVDKVRSYQVIVIMCAMLDVQMVNQNLMCLADNSPIR